MQVGRRSDERTECGRGIMDGHLLDSFAQCDVVDGLGLRQARRRFAEQTRRRQGMIGGLAGLLQGTICRLADSVWIKRCGQPFAEFLQGHATPRMGRCRCGWSVEPTRRGQGMMGGLRGTFARQRAAVSAYLMLVCRRQCARRNCEGVIPMRRLKARMKYFSSPKPHAPATAATLRPVSSSSFCAAAMRSASR